ncbi:MAG TPA: hypothetical protein GX525_10600 [Bacilli bacterium]|nr:hypothetical protein [Bacilli bacterium]
MKQWRVGTISMGSSLVLLGVVLFFSQFKGWDVVTIFLSWWPFILIVLGVEILVYVFMSKQENTFIKYDFLSIIFIGILGTVALSFMFLSVSGLLDEVRYAVRAEERTFDLPPLNETIPDNIERIVLDTDNQPIQIEGANGKVLQVFGTYRTSSQEEQLIENKEEYVSVSKANNTLYVKLKRLPEQHGIFHHTTSTDVVVIVPVDVKLEVQAENQNVAISPRNLQANWYVGHVGYVNIQLEENSDVQVAATIQSHMYDENEGREKKVEDKRVWKTGNGAHELNVVASFHDNVNVTVEGKSLAASE